MWPFDDASAIGVLDMDRRVCPSYEAGFDACDPLGSVLEWSGRVPARVLRRRCRSEGVDRSPYEDVSGHRSADGLSRHCKTQLNKSHFTLNSTKEAPQDRYHECSLLAAETGDYIMAHDWKRQQRLDVNNYQHGRPKIHMKSPTRPLLVTTLSNTRVEESLPRVEELFEKIDHDMLDIPITKQPLKSILNNPLPKSPQGILKKPKTKPYQDSKDYTRSPEGRRRQRASSESDNFYANYHIGYPVTGYDSRFSSNMKRAKDNSGSGYSYGTAISAYNAIPRVKSPTQKSPKYGQRTQHHVTSPIKEELHLLRTTAINSDTTEDPVELAPRQDTPAVTCPAVSPELPVSSVTATPPAAKKSAKPLKKKPKLKKGSAKMKAKVENTNEVEAEDKSGDAVLEWTMDTDILIQEIRKIEKTPSASPTRRRDDHIRREDIAKREEHVKREEICKREEIPKREEVLKREEIVKKEELPKREELHKKEEPHYPPPPAEGSNLESRESTKQEIITIPVTRKTLSRASPSNLPDSVAGVLRPSLFPRVPPYLKFINHDDSPCLKIPLPIQKHLKWKLTSITPIVVKKTLTNSGFRLVKSECDTAECPQEDPLPDFYCEFSETVDWVGIWGKHMKSLMFRAIKDGQKMNHFPGTFQIGRKDRLWRNLQKLATKYGVKEFGIMPKTYVLPHDLKLLKHDWEKHQENNEKWIIKPPASARGTGIKVVSRWTQIPKKRPVVVQRYVSKPYLINGSKFDMRLYVLVTSVHPLRIYLYKDGLARFASVKYNDEITSLNDRYMHLTNYSINKMSKNYTPNEDFAACEGHKWTLQTLFQYLKNDRNIDTNALWESMKDLVIKTIISGEASISSLTKANVTSRYNCYELFGIDVLLDEDLKPWLLEVNISPSLHSASPLDIHVKGPLVREVLNIAQFQIPNKTNVETLSKDKSQKFAGLPYDSRLYTIYLSKEERDKHIIYTNMEDRDLYLRDILSTLTPDDVRHLIQAEDEATQASDMERVFPTKHTYKYLNYLTGPRYYNRLFDAWETRYTDNRHAGLELLRNLCDIGYHLEVPPVPLKRAAPQLSALDRCRMMWTRRHRLFLRSLQFIPSHLRNHRPPRVACPPRIGPAGMPSRSRQFRRLSNRVHSTTPQTLRATDAESSNNVPMDTTTESQKKCVNSTESGTDLNRNVRAEINEPVAQSVK